MVVAVEEKVHWAGAPLAWGCPRAGRAAAVVKR